MKKKKKSASTKKAETLAEKIARYRAGYEKFPETEEEIAFGEACLADFLKNEPWEW